MSKLYLWQYQLATAADWFDQDDVDAVDEIWFNIHNLTLG